MEKRWGWCAVLLWFFMIGSGQAGEKDRVYEAQGKFSYLKPHGWNLQQAPGLPYRVVYKPSEGYAPNLKFAAEEFDGSIDEFIDHKRATLRTLFPGMRQFGPSAFQTETGLDGVQFAVEGRVRERNLRQTFYAVPGNEGRKFILTCSMLTEHVDESGEACDMVVRSFAVDSSGVE